MSGQALDERDVRIVNLEAEVARLRAVSAWMPLCKGEGGEDGQGGEGMIVMCPVGGELRCFDNGEIVCYEGARLWGFQLPPTVRLFVVRPELVTEKWLEAERERIGMA